MGKQIKQMEVRKMKKSIIFIILLFLCGCATSQYRIDEYKSVEFNPAKYSQMFGMDYVNNTLTEYRMYKKQLTNK